MKINIVLPFFACSPIGGIKVVYEYSNFLAKQGHEVTIYYTPDYCVKIRRIPFAVERLWRKIIQEKSKIEWFALNENINRKSIQSISDSSVSNGDIILATGIGTAVPIYNLSRNKGKKVYFIQGFENWGISDEEVYKTYELDMCNIVVSKWLKGIVDKWAKKPSILLSNAIDLNIFKVTIPIENRKAHTLAFHYRKEEYKGCKYAIEVVNILKQKYSDLEVYVISSQSKPKDLPRCCQFFYNVSPQEVAEINNKVQVFLCTTIEEGFGLPGLEAMACGCAFVSTKYTGVMEYAVDKKNALLSQVRDSKNLARNVIQLFENDRERYKIAYAGIQTAQKRDLKLNCEQFEQILKNI